MRSRPDERLRVRDLGVTIGGYAPGAHNAITDVPGVEVGQTTVHWGDPDLPPGEGPARTGVTVIWPARDVLDRPVAAGCFLLSGAGELTGRSEIEELGRIGTPIALTGTMQVGLVYDAICRYFIQRMPGVGAERGVLIPVVAECDDSYLNDARGFHLTHQHVYAALDGATGGPVAGGCVGGGTGMVCFNLKGGIGTSSRFIPGEQGLGEQGLGEQGLGEQGLGEQGLGEQGLGEQGGWTVGALVMTNFGRRPRLTFAGVPLGRYLPPVPAEHPAAERGSCIVVIATDAPLDGRQLARVARRAALGLGRTGSTGASGSGELLVAFSTSYRPGVLPGIACRPVVESDAIDPIFAAAIDAVEGAVLDSLCMAETTTGRYGRVVPALDLQLVRAVLARCPGVE